MIIMKRLSSIGFLIGISVMSYIIYSTGIENIMNMLIKININYMFLAIISYVILIAVYSYRWRQYIVDMKMKISFLKLFNITWIGSAINSITPMAISGGEPLKAYYLSKECSTKKSKSLATVIACDILDYGSFIIIDIIAVIMLYFMLNMPIIILYPLIATIGLGGIVMVLLINFCLNRRISKNIILFVTKIFKKIKRFKNRLLRFERNLEFNIDNFSRSLKEVSKKTIIDTIFLTGVLRLIEILKLYIIILAFGGTIEIQYIVIAVAFSTIASLVPLLPGSIGAVEPALILGLTLGGLGMPLATAVVLLDRIISLGLNISVGFGNMYFMNRNIGYSYVKR